MRGGADTIPALWSAACAEERSNAGFLVERDGAWGEVSWGWAADQVRELAAGFLALGLRRGDAFAILCSTRIEWTLVDYALATVGAVVVPIYATSVATEVAHVLRDSGAVGILVEDAAHAATVESARAELAGLEHVLEIADLATLQARGRAHVAEHPDAVKAAEALVRPDDLFTIIYTSGTTGLPKGCRILHRQYTAMAAVVGELADVVGPTDVLLLYLPLAHTFGRLLQLAAAQVGFTLAYCPDPRRVAEALPAVRPTILPSVPRLWEKLHDAVRDGIESSPAPRRALGRWALRVGLRASAFRENGEPLSSSLALQHAIARALVYRKVAARLGGRLRLGISGGAPLSAEVARSLHAVDVLVLEAYGLTECTTGCALNRVDAFRFGTVGRALPGFELRIADDGEVLVRSETIFDGYHGDEAATKAVVTADGWLRTGDVGSIDADGFLTITDRKKDLIVTAGGKNVAPQNLENALRAEPLVGQALVVGDRRPYLVALVTLDPAELRAWADESGLKADETELAGHPAVREAVQAGVDRVNERHGRHEQVHRFAILPHEFTIDGGELTPTLKVKRAACTARHADAIDALYAG